MAAAEARADAATAEFDAYTDLGWTRIRSTLGALLAVVVAALVGLRRRRAGRADDERSTADSDDPSIVQPTDPATDSVSEGGTDSSSEMSQADEVRT